jgi:pilus assembly protein CpaC
MHANSSKILTLADKEIPRAQVNNTELLKVVPLSPNQIQVSATKAGVTQINLWDQEGELYTVDVVIYGDSKELELLLESEFPNASLRVRPLASSVVLSGWVDRPDVVNRIVRMAEDYYPKVINNITVGGVQQVMLFVQVMEVSRSKLRNLGVDWANFGHTDTFAQSVSGLIKEVTPGAGTVVGNKGSTVTIGLFGQDNRFFAYIDALRQNDLAKVLAEPVLTTVSGRPASFNVGGEFPILIPQGLGTVAVEFKQFGTRVDFVPLVLGNGNVRLEVRPQVSEIDASRGVDLNGTRIPGLRSRWVDTAVEMRTGQTLALAGLIQQRVEAQTRGLPFLADIPWAGTFFRRNVENVNDIELLVMVRPELVDALDPSEVPQFNPGENTTSPSDVELYFRGYLEVPQCCQDGSCAKCRPGSAFMNQTIQEGLPVTDVGVGGQSSSEGPPLAPQPKVPSRSAPTVPTGEIAPDFDLGVQTGLHGRPLGRPISPVSFEKR